MEVSWSSSVERVGSSGGAGSMDLGGGVGAWVVLGGGVVAASWVLLGAVDFLRGGSSVSQAAPSSARTKTEGSQSRTGMDDGTMGSS